MGEWLKSRQKILVLKDNRINILNRKGKAWK